MFVRVWEYEVTAATTGAFVAAYGAGGHWAELFRKGVGYVGTSLSRDTDEPTRFVTVDRWTSYAEWSAFLQEWSDSYEQLDVALAGLTVSQRKLIEGTV